MGIGSKYPKKYQYDPKDVITVVEKKYIEYYRECRKLWMHGQAERILADTEVDCKDVKRMVMDGEIGLYELLTNEKYKYVYQLYMKQIKELIAAHI